MKNWQNTLLSTRGTIGDALRALEAGSLQIALVVDQDNRLQGTVTDGDIRRAILRGLGLDSPVSEIMNRTPTTAYCTDDRQALWALMRNRRIHHIPVIDEKGCVVGLEVLDELLVATERDNPVIIMAGGLGTRLRPLTQNRPKPMLMVGERPILEHILISLAEYGYKNFFFSVNYLSQVIKDHFEDGSRWGVSITYLDEKQRLGTAGALSLLPDRPTKPFIVMNGDVLTKLNFQRLMETHEQKQASVTVCVRNYDYQIPFGVAKVEGDSLLSIVEKPVHRSFVSAGIYVLNPEVLDRVPCNTFYDMPDLISSLIQENEKVKVFPITEYWLDVGRPDDMQRAIQEFAQEFA